MVPGNVAARYVNRRSPGSFLSPSAGTLPYRIPASTPGRPAPQPSTFGQAPLASSIHSCDQGGDLDRCEIAEGVRNRVGKDDLVAMAHRAAGINDVWNVSFALGRIGVQQRLPEAREHF